MFGLICYLYILIVTSTSPTSQLQRHWCMKVTQQWRICVSLSHRRRGVVVAARCCKSNSSRCSNLFPRSLFDKNTRRHGRPMDSFNGDEISFQPLETKKTTVYAKNSTGKCQISKSKVGPRPAFRHSTPMPVAKCQAPGRSRAKKHRQIETRGKVISSPVKL